jgi:hypothetical protein
LAVRGFLIGLAVAVTAAAAAAFEAMSGGAGICFLLLVVVTAVAGGGDGEVLRLPLARGRIAVGSSSSCSCSNLTCPVFRSRLSAWRRDSRVGLSSPLRVVSVLLIVEGDAMVHSDCKKKVFLGRKKARALWYKTYIRNLIQIRD